MKNTQVKEYCVQCKSVLCTVSCNFFFIINYVRITSAAIGQVLLYGAIYMKKSKIPSECLRQEIWNENLKVWICFCITVTQYVSLQLCRQSVVYVVTVWRYDGRCNAKWDYCLLQIFQYCCTLDTCPTVASGQQNIRFSIAQAHIRYFIAII